MSGTPTPKALAALRWIAKHEPVGWFGKTAPTMAMIRQLLRRGLIEQCETNPKILSLVKYRLTEAGRKCLTQEPSP